jgi:hypothetical protein
VDWAAESDWADEGARAQEAPVQQKTGRREVGKGEDSAAAMDADCDWEEMTWMNPQRRAGSSLSSAHCEPPARRSTSGPRMVE